MQSLGRKQFEAHRAHLVHPGDPAGDDVALAFGLPRVPREERALVTVSERAAADE